MPAVARTIAFLWLSAAPACMAADAFWPAVPAAAPLRSPDAAESPVQRAAFESPVPEAPAGRDEGRAASAPRDFHLPLGPRASPPQSQVAPAKRSEGAASALTVAGSLAVVLGLFFLVAWLMRRAAPRGSLPLPVEVVEVLGRAPLAARQQVYLVRVGAKLLLVSVTPDGAETLTEIDDPDEVARLAGLCRQSRPDSATASFRHVFDQLSREGPVFGLLGRRREAHPVEPDEDAWQEGRRDE